MSQNELISNYQLRISYPWYKQKDSFKLGLNFKIKL